MSRSGLVMQRLSLDLLGIETMEEVEILIGTVRVGFMGLQPREVTRAWHCKEPHNLFNTLLSPS